MILMNDFKAEQPELREAMLTAAKRVIESGWYVLGNEVTAFEKQWASICGVGDGVGVGNGMDAIEIALRALDIGLGDEVITAPMTAFATVLAIMRAGATPVLADIDPDTALLDIASVRRCVSVKTKAVLLVHLYGQIRDMDPWLSLCDEGGIVLIEDCAQAHLAATRGRVAGAFGMAGAYSFYPTKNLGALGDAGMLVSQDRVLAGRARQIRNYGQSERYHHPQIGLNSRLDEMQAALLTERLAWLESFTFRRQAVAERYRAEITNPLIRQLAAPVEKSAHVYHLFVVKCDARDALQKHLEAHGVQSLIHYPVPMHSQAPCAGLRCDPEGLANSEAHAQTCLSLPCHPQLSEADVSKVIQAVNAFGGA
ncbi:MAG: DegT/DnrJ/EryC1/StrS family aminotransferase [Undibacterium sp.]|uniref:DegT/DnrJ/EryC1/StrS family aminotransferase n=1 Tax=Undibacterium sp. TaxID=1914977 RepID=UPI0027235E4B|nr:DegT/DnrJ/EryC1/StrS family aminotransferase [Undibacterium sp.]MDO8652462.1 DegT/DnrJ/EryC1/StrS family aminotransferase [Undibacterium sp.]